MTIVVDPRIEQARARYARSLVGAWSTAQGTFGVMMAQHWEIRPDGRGRFVDAGVLGHPISETRFEWRQDQPFVFELRETQVVEYGPGEPAEDDDGDDGDGAVMGRQEPDVTPTAEPFARATPAR